jgi:hypothetical protein
MEKLHAAFALFKRMGCTALLKNVFCYQTRHTQCLFIDKVFD